MTTQTLREFKIIFTRDSPKLDDFAELIVAHLNDFMCAAGAQEDVALYSIAPNLTAPTPTPAAYLSVPGYAQELGVETIAELLTSFASMMPNLIALGFDPSKGAQNLPEEHFTDLFAQNIEFTFTGPNPRQPLVRVRLVQGNLVRTEFMLGDGQVKANSSYLNRPGLRSA